MKNKPTRTRSLEEHSNNPLKGFQVIDNECIWMKAGVVNFKLCNNNYDCFHCDFDKAMQQSLNSRRQTTDQKKREHWSAALKNKYNGSERPCRHALTGRVDAPKICTTNYDCRHCAYDQLLDHLDATGSGKNPHYTLAAGYRVADGYYYHPGHCWIRREHSGRLRMGFDEFSTRVFGKLDKISLPGLGMRVEQNKTGGAIYRDGHHGNFKAPVAGTVVAQNTKILKTPEICHADPYHEGWLLMIEPENLKRSLKNLYFGKESIQWTEAETARLFALLGPSYEKLAATGGQPIDDVYGTLPEIGWDRLARTFLLS